MFSLGDVIEHGLAAPEGKGGLEGLVSVGTARSSLSPLFCLLSCPFHLGSPCSYGKKRDAVQLPGVTKEGPLCLGWVLPASREGWI